MNDLKEVGKIFLNKLKNFIICIIICYPLCIFVDYYARRSEADNTVFLEIHGNEWFYKPIILALIVVVLFPGDKNV